MAWRLVEKNGGNSGNMETVPGGGTKNTFNLRDIYARFGPGQVGQVVSEPAEPTDNIEEIPALYSLDEIIAMRHLSRENIREIHLAKVRLGGQRVVQEDCGDSYDE